MGALDAMQDRTDFEQRIAEVLRQNDIPFEEGVVIGGVQTDFLIRTSTGRRIAVEAKKWPATDANLNRAIRQVRLYQENLPVDRAIFALPDLDCGRPDEGLVTEKELVDVLLAEIRQEDARREVDRVFSFGPELAKGAFGVAYNLQKTVFAAMPFSPEYDDVYFVAMAYAAHSLGVFCLRVDREDFQGDIVEEIRNLIRRSAAVIADLSESKPNVLYETGFAHALDRPTVHICSTPLNQLPFDVRNWNTLAYSKGQTFLLRDVLSKRLAALL